MTDSINDFDDGFPHSRYPFSESKEANPEEEHQFKVIKKNIKNTH